MLNPIHFKHVGVANVLSNIEFFVVNIMSWQITSGSANLNQATLTTPKHAQLTK